MAVAEPKRAAIAKTQRIPQAWVLVRDEDGGIVPATDDTGDPILVYLTLEDAREGAAAHAETYDIDCTPAQLQIGGR